MSKKRSPLRADDEPGMTSVDGSLTEDANGFGGTIVCLGASAGGLEALERFFDACPSDSGAAFVVIQHLSPDHKSLMSSLLARHTHMDVVMAEGDMPLEANRVHLIPPGAMMSLRTSDRLWLTRKSPREFSLPIDTFMLSMAELAGPRGVGVILSGTGSDGSKGMQALASKGALLMVQDPDSAKFDGMPRSAISTGLDAHIAPPEELAGLLGRHLKGDALPGASKSAQPLRLEEEADDLSIILRLLFEHDGIDFADYKPATVNRRIERRMQIRHTLQLTQYLALLRSDPSELHALRREMLISVTSFFRDPDVFDTLANEVIEPLASRSSEKDHIRVWCAGVASGEEAYTVAMLFLEAFERHKHWPTLKIFATDVDQGCIDTASAGWYQESAIAELSPERLARFFTRKEAGVQVRGELRQSIVFARHNLLADPPFTRMDLVLCRNTLIYFKSGAQERALQALQYALNEGGVLMLGSSESLSERDEGMAPVASKFKIFRMTRPAGHTFTEVRRALSIRPRLETSSPAPPRLRSRHGQSLADQGMSALLSRYAPPTLVINRQHEILHIFGDASAYLSPREGSASLALNRNLPDGLIAVASALLFKVEREASSQVSSPVLLTLRSGTQVLVRLAAHPLARDAQNAEDPLILLSFERQPDDSLASAGSATLDVASETQARMQKLEQELAATRENLQTTIEALETSNEELQSTNEELMASNEELQSSNEELQSLNEELGTVNSEYQEKLHELNRINADLDSMTKVTGLATIFVDDTLQITRFSPDAAQIFRFKISDVARQLDDINHSLDYPNLVQDIQETLSLRRLMEREVWTRDGQRAFLTRILPYPIASTHRYGAVITFIDITAFQDARRLQALLDALPEHVAVLDPSGQIILVNAAWRRFALANGDPNMRHSGPGANYLAACRKAAEKGDKLALQALNGIRCVLEGSQSRFSLEYPCHSPVEHRWFVLNVAPIQHADMGAVVSHVNVTAWREPGAAHPLESEGA